MFHKLIYPTGTGNTSSETGSSNKIQNRNDVIATETEENEKAKNSADADNDKQKPISSLSGERTHGFTNASGSPVVGGKEGDGSKPINISSILAQIHKINQVTILIVIAQWGSEIRKCPNFKWFGIGQIPNGWVFKWDLKSGQKKSNFKW